MVLQFQNFVCHILTLEKILIPEDITHTEGNQ